MAGAGLAPTAGKEFEAKITWIVVISCILAATGGLMFGYDVGVSGGVTSMPDFLKKFFPVELDEAVKSHAMKVIVVKKGQLGLYAGRPLPDIELTLRSLLE